MQGMVITKINENELDLPGERLCFFSLQSYTTNILWSLVHLFLVWTLGGFGLCSLIDIYFLISYF